MRYHHDKPTIYLSMYGVMYTCDHPIYHNCTLYLSNNEGLAVIQQRFDPDSKVSWWGEIDPWLTDAIYLNPGFRELFEKRSDTATNGLYPTMTVRQIMWALRMKPSKRERWETYFDRKNV